MKRFLIIFLALAVIAGLCIGAYYVFFYEAPQEYPNPTAVITLSDGSRLNLELYPKIAPNTVANFVELAQAGFYNGSEIYRVVPGVLIQTGDPIGDGTGGAGYYIRGEFGKNGFTNGISHVRGTVSMARQTGYNTGSSQFFILQGSYPQYDGQYAAFGALTDEESLYVLDQIASRPIDGSYRPLTRIFIQSIQVETYGAEYHAVKIEQGGKK